MLKRIYLGCLTLVLTACASELRSATSASLAATTGLNDPARAPDSTESSRGVSSTDACPAGAIAIQPGTSIQSVVTINPAGASFCIKAGLHRLQAITPKNDQHFYGERGQSILNGAKLITAFTREGAYFVASNQTQAGPRYNPECIEPQPRCAHPEMLLIDDQPLIAVDTLAKVVRGKFFFDYNARKIYFLDDPNGRKVEASVTGLAFSGGANNVVVQGLIVEKYSTPIQWGAISGSGGTGWIIRRNESRLNYAVGFAVKSGFLLYNYSHHNGEMGAGCNGDNTLVEGNELAHNGWFSGLSPFWEGGGMKCAVTKKLVIRGNYSHHNNSVGLWTDIDNIDTIYEKNRVEFNSTTGISHEISYRAVIRNNQLKGNGGDFHVWLWGGQVQIQNSRDVEVYGNRLEVTDPGGNAVGMIEQDRGDGAYGPYKTMGNYIHHNVIVCRNTGGCNTGMVTDIGVDLKSQNNRMDYNAYYLNSVDVTQFLWGGYYQTFAALRTDGQELHGTIAATAPPQ